MHLSGWRFLFRLMSPNVLYGVELPDGVSRVYDEVAYGTVLVDGKPFGHLCACQCASGGVMFFPIDRARDSFYAKQRARSTGGVPVNYVCRVELKSMMVRPQLWGAAHARGHKPS